MENDSRAIRDLWTRLIASEEGFKSVYEEAIIAWNGFSPEPVGMRMEIENLKVLVRDDRK